MTSFDARQFAGPEDLARAAAADVLSELRASGPVRGNFGLALSGGRIAGTFYSALASQVVATSTFLKRLHFFWSDERCVPPDHPESNFRLAHELLLSPLKIPDRCIHRIRGEEPPESAARAAEAELVLFVPRNNQGQPVLDLVLLGMGEDGHVASLFPEESEDATRDPAAFRCVTAVKPPPLRITMGYPAIAAARQVWVLASGEGKARALRESLRPDGRTPLARVLKMRSATTIYTDIQLPK
jgi:6-phosphogluconolactonase